MGGPAPLSWLRSCSLPGLRCPKETKVRKKRNVNFQKEIHEKRELWVPVKLSTLGPTGQVRVCLLAPVLLREPGYGVGARDPSSGVEGGWARGSLLWPLLSSQSLRVLVYVEVRLGEEACLVFVSLCPPSPGPAVGQYASPIAKRCCQDGLTRLPMVRTCEQRVARVQQPACRGPFLSCCQFAEGLRKKARARGQVGLARGKGLSGVGGAAGAPGGAERHPPHGPALWSLAKELLQEEDLIDEDDIPVRSFFPENWLWKVEAVDHSSQ